MATAKTATIQQSSIPAPIGGLNARDSIANMPPTDAVTLDNFFPETTDVRLRQGYNNWATGLPGWVETVMAYQSNITGKLFAISGGSIYDVTNTGAVGAPVVTGLSNSRWQHANIGTPGGQFLYAVNGADDALLYNGSAWTAINTGSTPAITGVTTNKLIGVNLYKNRIWFTEKDSLRIWYLPVQSIGGAAQSIDFSSLFKLGGYLMGMITITIDNAAGVQDYCAFVTSQGELALYAGIDPTEASTFQLQGLFRIGRPIGRRFYAKLAADTAMITADGITLFSKILMTDRAQQQDTLSYKIINLLNTDVQNYGGNFGWQPLLHPIGNKLFINVPYQENTTQYQYVMNTISGAWCRFTNWNAACWELFGDNVYFGGSGIVGQADTGNDDNNANIQADVKQAFSYFGTTGRNKRFTMLRPIISANGTIKPTIGLNIDFSDVKPTGTPTFSSQGGSMWNISPWNISPWGSPNIIRNDWQTVGGIGFCAALRMLVSAKGITMNWQATDYVYELGGIL